MTSTDCTRASSTESPTLERGSVQDVRTFSGTLSSNMLRPGGSWYDNELPTNRIYTRAGVINTFMYVNHDSFSYWLCQALGGHNLTDTTPGEKDKNGDDWGNNNGMPNAVIVLHNTDLGAQIHIVVSYN